MSDESALTGESMAVHKDAAFVCAAENTPVAERSNMLYSGCFITGGSGKAVVTGVGDNTEFGKIARELTHQDKSSTPLQEKLGRAGQVHNHSRLGCRRRDIPRSGGRDTHTRLRFARPLRCCSQT